MKKVKLLIELQADRFKLNDVWYKFHGTLKDAVSETIPAKVLDIKEVKTPGVSEIYEVTYRLAKMSQKAIKDILKRRREGERLQAIADIYALSRQRIHQICVAHGVTKAPPPDKIYPDEEEGICSVCDRKFIRKGKQVYLSMQKKTCSATCANAAKARPKGGEWSKNEEVTLTCAGCNKPFNRTNYEQKICESSNKSGKYYCTLKCYQQHRGG